MSGETQGDRIERHVESIFDTLNGKEGLVVQVDRNSRFRRTTGKVLIALVGGGGVLTGLGYLVMFLIKP